LQRYHEHLLVVEVEVQVDLLEVEEIGLWEGEIRTLCTFVNNG